MQQLKRLGYVGWCGLLAVTLLVWQGACGPAVPGGGGDLPDSGLRFLPDPEITPQETSTEITSPPKEAPSTEPQREKATQESRPEPAAEPTPDAVPDAVDGGTREATPDPQPPEQVIVPESAPETGPPLASWIGGPCRTVRDCDFQDAVCLTATDGYPEGTCTLPCTRLCPDKNGQPGTFCLDIKTPLNSGGCVSRCDYQLFPTDGCRKGYHCTSKSRFNEPQSEATVCVPGQAPPQTGCYQQLTQAGVSFTPRANPMDKPDGYPNLTCSVVDAVSVNPPIHGVDWVTGANKRAAMFMRCELALAMSRFSQYLKSRNITKVMHYGTYNCRTIRTDSGSTSTLSNHGLGNAIDLAAFWDSSNKEYNLVKHWDHSTTWKKNGSTGCHSTTFNSPEAKMLYEIGCAMWTQKIFSLVLTPNYNNVHDNHFHVDMSGNGNILALPMSQIQTHHGH